MSRKYCKNWKIWIDNLSHCAYYRSILCEDVEECPAHYDDDEDDIGEPYYDGSGEDDDEEALLITYKGIIVDLKDVIEVTDEGETRKVILLMLDNGINLKSEYEVEFFEELQEAKQTKAVVKFLVDIDDNSINSIYYPKVKAPSESGG